MCLHTQNPCEHTCIYAYVYTHIFLNSWISQLKCVHFLYGKLLKNSPSKTFSNLPAYHWYVTMPVSFILSNLAYLQWKLYLWVLLSLWCWTIFRYGQESFVFIFLWSTCLWELVFIFLVVAVLYIIRTLPLYLHSQLTWHPQR
jgi:hypothetical protein